MISSDMFIKDGILLLIRKNKTKFDKEVWLLGEDLNYQGEELVDMDDFILNFKNN